MKALTKRMCCKSLKFFCPSMTKIRLFKVFLNLYRNHLLMADIFKLNKYQTFGLMKMYKMSKIWYAYNNFSLWKSLLFDKLGVKNFVFKIGAFLFFQVLKLLWTIFKNFLENPSFSMMDFESSTISQMLFIYRSLTMKRRFF